MVCLSIVLAMLPVVPAFNAGAGLAEDKNGTQCLKYEPTMAGEFRSGCFKVGDRSNPDVRTLTVSEAGSHFGCDVSNQVG